jgi:hypothetical protein
MDDTNGQETKGLPEVQARELGSTPATKEGGEMKVGDMVYTFDSNHRVYVKNEKGYGVGGPIYSEHFQPVEIIGENEKEFLTSRGTINKRSKKLKFGNGWYSEIYTEEERAAAIWKNEHVYKLTRAVERCDDITKLKQIAEIVGYRTKKEER